jgi:hypothetical protein
MGDHQPRQTGRRYDVSVEGLLPRLVLVAADGAPHVVHQHIDAAECFRRLRRETLGIPGERDIADHGQAAAALGLNLSSGLPQDLLAPGTDSEVAALGGQTEGDRLTDAAAAARDDGHFIAQAEIHDL